MQVKHGGLVNQGGALLIAVNLGYLPRNVNSELHTRLTRELLCIQHTTVSNLLPSFETSYERHNELNIRESNMLLSSITASSKSR